LSLVVYLGKEIIINSFITIIWVFSTTYSRDSNGNIKNITYLFHGQEKKKVLTRMMDYGFFGDTNNERMMN